MSSSDRGARPPAQAAERLGSGDRAVRPRLLAGARRGAERITPASHGDR
jgi:hypothetical protein